jgi:hypothetical protein
MIRINKSGNTCLEENLGKNIIPLSVFESSNFVGTEPLEIVLFYKKGTSLLKLQECFFKAVEHYNLFSSRLIMIGDNEYALQYCTDGIEVKIHPPVDVTSDVISIDEIKKMMVHVKTAPGEPLFAATGIPVKDGVLGALSLSHAVADGILLMLFLFSWGCILEGKDFLRPSAQRLFTGKPVRSDEIDKSFTPPLSGLSDNIQKRIKNISNIKKYTTKEYFSQDFLDEMKDTAKSENAKYSISNNQIMTSFLLKKYHKYILPDTDRIALRTPINIRYVHPDIDPMYIGNANFNSVAEYTKNEIDKMSILQIAYRIKESIMMARDENYVKEISGLTKYGGIEFKTEMFENHPSYNVETDVFSTNLTHLNDLESMGLGLNIGRVFYMGYAARTSFIMLKEKSGRIFAEITGRYPFDEGR